MVTAIIYNRVSSKDQKPELQKQDCIKLAEGLGIKDLEYLQEKESAWKEEAKREIFESIKPRIISGEVQIIIVWDLDRLFRNRRKAIEFIRNYSKIGLKVHSFRQQWLEALYKIPEPFNEIMSDLMLQIVCWMAEEESNKKSERVKNAVVRTKGKPTKSYKGNKWGRKSFTKRIQEEIIKLKEEGHSIREIAESVFFWDEHGHKKPISKSYVHKIVSNLNDKPNTSLSVVH